MLRGSIHFGGTVGPPEPFSPFAKQTASLSQPSTHPWSSLQEGPVFRMARPFRNFSPTRRVFEVPSVMSVMRTFLPLLVMAGTSGPSIEFVGEVRELQLPHEPPLPT